MHQSELLIKLEILLQDSKTGILALVNKEGRPEMRWLTPVLLPKRPGCLFAITSLNYPWVQALRIHQEVQWSIQRATLNEIIHLNGKINVVDNPSLKLEVMQALGNKWCALWVADSRQSESAVLETVIELGRYYRPLQAEKITVGFSPAPQENYWT